MADSKTPQNNVEFALILGQILGQLEGLVSQVKNRSQKDDAVAKAIAKLETLPDDIQEIKQSMATLDQRMTAVETARIQMETGRSLIAAFFKSPTMAWVLTIAGFVGAVFTGKISIHG